MNILEEIYKEIIGFFAIEPISSILKSGDYKVLLTFKGISAVIRPLFTLLLVLEIVKALIYRQFKIIDYKIPFFSHVLNTLIGRFISLSVIVFCIGFFGKYALFHTSFTFYWFIYSYVVWELGNFIYHYYAHKVRLLWCLHSTHHSLETMNLSLAFTHFFLEGPYADFVRVTLCILLGVDPSMLFIIIFIDGMWGGFIHISEGMIKNGKWGFWDRVIFTPSHHRAHHAKNPLYMDTNFAVMFSFWDKIFNTYQALDDQEPPVYGISREMNVESFSDSYFGEFGSLIKDVIAAPGLKNKFLYIFMPPGWTHIGDHKTAKIVRNEYMYIKRNQVT
jgi:sterol desaturase/sphingolipid hydroxylase (fatty acid hydroxylase superfamily)